MQKNQKIKNPHLNFSKLCEENKGSRIFTVVELHQQQQLLPLRLKSEINQATPTNMCRELWELSNPQCRLTIIWIHRRNKKSESHP